MTAQVIQFSFPNKKDGLSDCEREAMRLIAEARTRELEPEEEDWLDWANSFFETETGGLIR